MANIKDFRKANKITQKELADYLNVTASAICQWENGLTKISMDCFEKILNNEEGWDVSMLMNNANIYNSASGSGNNTANVNVSSDVTMYQNRIKELEKQLEEEKARSAEYWELLKEAIKRSRE